ncbi:DUF350 domain-containing protein [Paenibacillus radicis (ex Gao et al. 2016)]|uniref:DUF350 domain-containing protein n=1 Tax=Paenibacillus radicis (ex Gao et al. 2016) TaxID=1737354 RepID=A0A917LWL8_9BACL|nr:DUF350 domain-containing protein [Paenibacillus radicis (ex Gao et al. 2016)]GGG62105.1 DUF350 domain-containing protein [Paenibacillus radicis (ex Gao et al. 2016)]
MTWTDLLQIPVWTAAGAILLFVLMYLDSLTTKYHDFQEMKDGNIAVTTRFVMKLGAQAYILAQSIGQATYMWEALVISVASFITLLVLEWLFRRIFAATAGIQLEQGIHDGKIGYALLAGSLHIAGALIIGSV